RGGPPGLGRHRALRRDPVRARPDQGPAGAQGDHRLHGRGRQPSSIGESELLDYARSVEATVYCVGIRGESGLLARSRRGFMRRLAKETGGDLFFPDRVGDLIKVFSGISDELHNHYLLAYTPKRPPDSSSRPI